jgi:hypothetical protein
MARAGGQYPDLLAADGLEEAGRSLSSLFLNQLSAVEPLTMWGRLKKVARFYGSSKGDGVTSPTFGRLL